MKKLSLWVSTNDLKLLILLMDPCNSGTPRFRIISEAIEKQKMMHDFYNSTQIKVFNFFYPCLTALERQMLNCERLLTN